ncbi:MAG: hypothetical protein ACTSYI_17680 [Promethearchaeota archaeon]
MVQQKSSLESNSSQAPIKISKADFDRAFRKAKEFQRLVERGKKPIKIMHDMIRMIETDNDIS